MSLRAKVVVLLLVVAGLLSAAAARPRLEAALAELFPARLEAQAIAASLRRRGDALGAVELSGDELRLKKGALRLRVSDHGSDERPGTVHFHVLASIGGAESGALDACVLGIGPSREAQLAQAGEAYVGSALPPLLSQLEGDAVLASSSFWGDEAWAVPGMRGFAGPVLARGGADPSEFADAALFSDIPELPRDGRLHLVKAVVAPGADAWLRTVEIDGRETSVTGARLVSLGAQAKPGMIVRYAVYGERDVPPPPDAQARALERLRARGAWLPAEEVCPAELVPAVVPPFAYSGNACRGGRLLECLARCERGAAGFCYAAAQEVLPSGVDPGGAQALFLRSCRLGYASGCTNAAAGRSSGEGAMDLCGERTFERICERAGDPWACTMIGAALSRADRPGRDLARARSALDKACQGDPEDPACRAAKAIAAKLGGSK